MNHIFLDSPKTGLSKEYLFQNLIDKIHEYNITINSQTLEIIYLYALEIYAGKKRYSGEDYITHPLNIAILLTELGADETQIYASLFCDALQKGQFSIEEAANILPVPVLKLVTELNSFNSSKQHTISEDAILIKLAERLHNMRTLQFMDKIEWKKRAKETLELFIPLALRLENQKLANELNHLCMKYI